MEADLAYFERRLMEEQQLASLADRVDVRAVHLKLAALYQERLTKLKGSEASIDCRAYPPPSHR